VDTHDELDIKETTPDYSEWLAIRDYNASLKRAVESRWSTAGVPTISDVETALENQEVPPQEICAPGSAPCILIVDDDTHIAGGVEMIFDRRGYDVVVAHSAEEALKRLETLRPDLILSDLEMGSGLTGLQFCEHVRAIDEIAQTPFILATAAGIDLAANRRIDGFLVKPYELAALVHLVATRLSVNG
jgi:CheY-like chemotaxis protein